ncbi:MAG: hypothetical protein ACQEXJ_13410 [Myxococcota bacterium]
MPFRKVSRILLGCLVATSLAVSCDDGGGPESLLLEIRSDPPQTASGNPLEAVRILFTDGETNLPVDPSDSDFNYTPDDEVWNDPVREPFVVRVEYGGQTFADDEVVVLVTGWVDGRAVTRFERTLDLTEARVVSADLRAAPEDCDADGDGFADCAMAGCCAPNRDELSDCEPGEKTFHPFFSGGEPCDDLDNDCDGFTDEGFPKLGELCDGGDSDDCATGTWTCNATGDGVECLESGGVGDTCGDGVDNDCDGDTDEGC